ncbi:arrestin domain-containing protein 3-like [Neoarius graeffei]|uniref:arrestin domain-containing protein 3-like n=1 Tax=Neoarius graeffei TaxID=443677 RepID=UPI00298CF339|nr:arrestin domain-containing protein 3-like [Neoarius graeffei]
MSGSIKTFSITYDPINQSNTFSSGDSLKGRVVLELKKQIKIDKLYIKCKGDARVHWNESNSNSDDSYSSHERYFKLKQIFIWDSSVMENSGATLVTNGETYNNLVMPGYHAFPFSFQLPHGSIPSSFKGRHGSITYVLQARLSRSWKRPQTVKKEFTFLSSVHGNGAHLMTPLSESVEKKMKIFTSGSASVRASTDKKGYMQGERIKVETHIENSSSRALKLKFKLEQKQTFFAKSRRKHTTAVIFKAVEDPIPSRSRKTFTSRLRIPSNLDITIPDCNIIKVEYMLKVYLDIPYARDPEIIFPVVIVPAGQFCIPQQSQAGFQTCQNTCESIWTGSSFQSAFVALPYVSPATALGPALNLYPSVYTHPANPDEPPPSYTDIFPDSNPSA